MIHITKEKLKDIVSKSGIIDEKAFDTAEKEASRLGQSIADVLVGRGDMTEDYLAELLESYFGVPRVDLRTESISSEILQRIPEAYAKTHGVVLFEYNEKEKRAKIAMLDPLDYYVIEFLRAKLGVTLEPHLTTPTSLRYVLKQYKQGIGKEFSKVISENAENILQENESEDLAKMAEAVPVITILDNIMEHAVSLNASDIHFEPLEKEVLVRYRVDGVLNEILSFHKAIDTVLVARVKVLASLQIDEHAKPQDGRFRFDLREGGSIDVRVNIMPTMNGEKVEMRLLKSSGRPLSLLDLGLSKKAAATINEEIKKPHVMLLVTGPTGHGKTTTLYAILHILNTPKVNITTIEDPVEYSVPRINQTQVNVKAGITFSNGLRSILRQNPDIIMVGEIRDKETVEISVHAALTGHLVLSSLHTNDAPSALPRLLDMGAPAFLLSSTVNLVIAQRLVRKICRSCVYSYKISTEVERLIKAQMELNDDAHIKKIPTSLYAGKGCKVCNKSGFQGQIGVFETLRVTDGIRDLLLRHVPAGEIRRLAIKEGMTTMFEDGLNKVEQGITTIEEVLRVVRE